MTDIFEALAAEFPRESIHWRAQSLTQDGTKALALAYIDARDVMDRLDVVCGPDGWSDSYVETAKGRVICSIAVKTPSEGWVSKSDGAGDTDVEGEKGGMSDAFKRAAVKWGVGRYLYRLPSVWAPCESKDWNGKKQWKAWKGSPWDSLREGPKAVTATDGDRALIATLAQAAGVTIQTIIESYSVKSLDKLTDKQAEAVIKRLQLTLNDKKKEAA
jgi:hypothetical protein